MIKNEISFAACANTDREIIIQPIKLADISTYVSLSKAKRLAYEKAQPQFWKYAGDAAEESQTKWFEELLHHDDYIMLTASYQQTIFSRWMAEII